MDRNTTENLTIFTNTLYEVTIKDFSYHFDNNIMLVELKNDSYALLSESGFFEVEITNLTEDGYHVIFGKDCCESYRVIFKFKKFLINSILSFLVGGKYPLIIDTITSTIQCGSEELDPLSIWKISPIVFSSIEKTGSTFIWIMTSIFSIFTLAIILCLFLKHQDSDKIVQDNFKKLLPLIGFENVKIKLIKKIGQGNSGIVFKARMKDNLGETLVAAKGLSIKFY